MIEETSQPLSESIITMAQAIPDYVAEEILARLGTPEEKRQGQATTRAVGRVREERKLLDMMARMSKGLQRPLCHPGKYAGAEGALITLKAAGMAAEANPGATINLFVQGFGTQEAEGILAIETVLLALSRGIYWQDALDSAGIVRDAYTGHREAFAGLCELLGSLPALARILLGKEEG